jgi:hypothetical protein
MPGRIEPAPHHKFHYIKHSVQDLNSFAFLELSEIIADMKSQPLPPRPQTEIQLGPGSPRINNIAKISEHNSLSGFETNLQKCPYYLFAMREQYNYFQCGIKKKDFKTYYDNALNEENHPLHFTSFNNGWLTFQMIRLTVSGNCTLLMI